MLLAACALQGCFSSTVLVQVRTNGTGTATLTSQVHRKAREQFVRLLTDEPDNTPVDQYVPALTNRELEDLFGTKVRLVSSDLQITADEITRTTIVAFDDITAISLPFPPVAGDMVGSSHSFAGVPPDKALISFALRPHENGDRLLIVKMPESPMSPAEPDLHSPSPEDVELDRKIKQGLRGSTLRLLVELDVPVLRTNAPARDGDRVTILDFDFARMMNSDQADKLEAGPSPLSIQELLWTLSDVPGAIVPTEREVFLEFEAPQAPAPSPPPARPAAPDTEVYLASLKIAGDRIEIGGPKNISTSAGYDNQPSFTRDGSAVLFTSGRGGGQTDIYRYDIVPGRVSQVTTTPESEYSPTETPDQGISVIRVEADGTQRLWRFTTDGRDPRVVLDAVKPVGYHAWADDHTLALFILGQTGTSQPSTLQIADSRTGSVRTVASDIGRSIQRIPGGSAISFVQRERTADKTTFLIKEIDPASGSIRLLTPAVEGPGDVDCAWTPDGTLLMARGDRLFAWRRARPSESSSPAWREVASLERLGLHGVTRLAINPDGTAIALVANPN